MLFQSDAFSSAFIHAMEYAACGGANMTECLEASAQIRDNDRESWHRAWVTLAERVRRQAALALSQRRKRHAHTAFLRAAQYYKNAGWFMGHESFDARRATTEKASRTCFETALRLDETVRPLADLENDAAIASAYFYRADFTVNPAPRPTAFIVGDCGTSPMTLYFGFASVLARYGWHCVILSLDDDFNDGNPVPQIMNAVAQLPLVDPSCLALATFRENDIAFHREAGPTYCRFLFNERAIGNASEIAEAVSQTHRAGSAPPAALESLTELHERVFRWLDTSR